MFGTYIFVKLTFGALALLMAKALITAIVAGLIRGLIIFMAVKLGLFIGKKALQAYKKHKETKKVLTTRLKTFCEATKAISINDLNEKYEEDDVIVIGLDEEGNKTEEEQIIHKKDLAGDLENHLDDNDGALIVEY